MNKSPVTVKGYVTVLPKDVDPRQAGVAIIQDNEEYRILPRGAGIDLDDEVNVPVEATGLLEEADGIKYLSVRGYKVFDDEEWMEE